MSRTRKRKIIFNGKHFLFLNDAEEEENIIMKMRNILDKLKIIERHSKQNIKKWS